MELTKYFSVSNVGGGNCEGYNSLALLQGFVSKDAAGYVNVKKVLYT